MVGRPRFSGARLRGARLAAGLSQRDLAILLDCSEMTISKYESGRYSPEAGRVIEIARALEVEAESLFAPEVANEPDAD